MLDFAHAFAKAKLHVWKFDMATAPIGTGGLTRRYAVPIQQRGSVLKLKESYPRYKNPGLGGGCRVTPCEVPSNVIERVG